MSGSAHYVLAPEIEVRSFKQQDRESLKDAWYRISNAHRRCTKKHSTMILLGNFYVGITSWYRYVLDTLTGGNFLGTPALEAINIIESLVGTPPVNDIKNGITLEDVIKKLEAMEKNLSGLLGNANKVGESLSNINRKVTALEASAIHRDQNFRIGELEEAFDTLSSTFVSIEAKRQKAPVGKGKKIMYVPKGFKPKFPDVVEIEKKVIKPEGELCYELFKFSSQELLNFKNPLEASRVFEKASDDVDVSTLDN